MNALRDWFLGELDDWRYARAQRRGARLALKMRRDGTLAERSPRKVVRLPAPEEPDVVLSYLDQLRSMGPSESMARDIDELEWERRASVARLLRECAHCGATIRTPYDPDRNQAQVNGATVCHPNDDGPDCYRLVTVYHQPLGSLIGQREQWSGVHRLHSLNDVVRELGIDEDRP